MTGTRGARDGRYIRLGPPGTGMGLDVLAEYPMVKGLVFALAGVGSWVAALLFVNWLWNRYRSEDPASEG